MHEFLSSERTSDGAKTAPDGRSGAPTSADAHRDAIRSAFAETASGIKSKERPGGRGNRSIESVAQRIYATVSAAYIDFDAHASDWVESSEVFGLCYFDAYRRHQDVIDEQKKWTALKAALAFSVLSAVCQGSIAVFFTVGRARNWMDWPEWKVNSINDGLQALSGDAFSALKDSASAEMKSDIAEDPLRYYLSLKQALAAHVRESKHMLNAGVQWASQLVSHPHTQATELSRVDIDAFEERIKGIKATVHLFRPPPSVDRDALTHQISCGLWARWLAANLYLPPGEVHIGRSGAEFQRGATYLSPGTVIEKELCRLKIAPALEIGAWTSESDLAALLDWARNWKPTPPAA